MKCRRISLSLGLVVGILLTGCGATDEARGPLPNILVISLDACRADHLGCYGYPRPTSPFLDSLAHRGLRFAQAYANTHGTAPSHTTILSSLYQETHRVEYSSLRGVVPPEAVMMQEVLAARGYVTLGVTDGGRMGRKFGFARGFEAFDDGGRGVASGSRRLVELIRQHSGAGRPIFAFYHTYEIHSPYLPPDEYRGLFGQFESTFVPSSENLLEVAHAARRRLGKADLEYLEAMYDAGIRYTDDTLRQRFAELEELGFFDRYLLVVTADHGEEFAEHGGLLHRDLLYEELIRVPLIVAGSGVPQGRVEGRLVSSIDIAPTVLGYAGLPVPETMAGTSLLEMPRGEEPVVVSQYRNLRYALRRREWKLIESTSPPGLELFNLREDPAETRNMASERPELAARLQSQLAQWRRAQQPGALAETGSVSLSEEERRRLKALGYLGDD
jgi:arylsulfatase